MRKIAKKLGIDGAIAFTILSRIIQACGGLVSLIFIARYLSADEQGYYYTFASILAIQVFFELGLSGIITQYTAHEFAHLRFSVSKELTGDEYYKSRLSSLLHFCVKWFGIIAFLLFFVLLGAGFYFFNKFNKELSIDWQLPWLILCFSTSLNLFIDPILGYFDGLGEVKDMAKLRLIQKSSYVVLLFIFFACDLKLYSGALASLICILINYLQIIFSDRIVILKVVWRAKSEWVIDYVKEIFPFQWKIALSWISGYLIFQLFNPVLFATDGAVAAGQMGMTLQVLNGIASLSMSWVTTKIPVFSEYIALKNHLLLNQLFKKTIKNQMLVNFILLVIFIIGLVILRSGASSYSIRFLPIIPSVFLSLVCFANQLAFSWATYLRCHKQEPFLMNSVVMGILSMCSTLVLGHYYGLIGIVNGYTFITLVIGLPWAYLIFERKKAEWQK